MRVPDTRRIARTGVNHVRTLVEAKNHIFQEVEQHNDFGIDGYVEFTQAGHTTGIAVAVQIKSGTSYLDATTGRGQVRCQPAHVEYWQAHVLPVVLVVHDPERGLSWWADVRAAALVAHKTDDGVLVVPVDHPLDEGTLDAFVVHWMSAASGQSAEVHFGRAMAMLGSRGNLDAAYEGCRALFRAHRDNPASWSWLILLATSPGVPEERKRIVYPLLFMLGRNPDIHWHAANVIPGHVADEARRMLVESLRQADVRLLLSMVDENGFDRGTRGQAVRCLLELLPFDRRGEHLWSLAFDTGGSEPVRYWAFVLLLDHLERQLDEPREELLGLVARYLQEFPLSEYNEVIRHIAGLINETGHMVPLE